MTKPRKTAVMIIMAVLLLFLAFISPFVINKLRLYGAELSGDILLELVKRESNNYYTIEYKEARLSFSENKLVILGFRIFPDSAYASAIDSAQFPLNSFEVNIPTVEITLKSFLEIFLKEELNVVSLQIIDPQIGMVRTNEPEIRRPFSLEAGDLYLLISQYLKIFKIEYFNIQEGGFSFDPAKSNKDTTIFEIRSLDFALENFLIDVESGKAEGLFFSEAISLVINNQTIFLSDNVHQLNFDKLTISTQDEVVRFEGIHIHPREELNLSFAHNPEKSNVYDIQVPMLELNGVDFIRAYRENNLSIESIAILDPRIFVFDKEKSKSAQIDATNSFGQLLIQYFDQIKIGSVSLTNGLLDLKLERNKQAQSFRLEEATIKLKDFSLDSGLFLKDNASKIFQEIDLRFKNHTFNFPDSIHRLELKDFQLSTEQQFIKADSVVLYPRVATLKDNPLIYANIPAILLAGFDWQAMLAEEEINMGSFFLSNPDIKLILPEKGKKSDSVKLTYDQLAARLLNPLKGIAFDSINLHEGRFHLWDQEEELFGFENVFLAVKKFNLDAKEIQRPDQLFFSEQLTLDFSDFDIEFPDKSHLVTLQDFHFSTIENHAILNGINIVPIHEAGIDRDMSITGKASRIEFDGLYLKAFLDESHVLLDSLTIRKPEFDIVQHSPQSSKDQNGAHTGTPKWLNYLSINHFFLDGGVLRFADDEQPRFSIGKYDLSVHNFSLDSVLLLDRKVSHQMDDFIFDGRHVTYLDPAIGHSLKVDLVALRQRQRQVELTNISILPNQKDTSRSQLQLTSPSLLLDGIDIEDALLDNRIDIDQLWLKEPKVVLHFAAPSGKPKKKWHSENIYSQISSALPLFRVKEWMVDSGHVVWDAKDFSGVLGQFNLLGESFFVSENTAYDPTRPFFSQQVTFSANAPKFDFSGSPFSVDFKNLLLQSNPGKIQLDSFSVSSTAVDNPMDLFFPSLVIDTLDWVALMEESWLKSKHISFDQPEVRLDFSEKDDKKKQELKLPIDRIDIDKLEVQSGTFSQMEAQSIVRKLTNLSVDVHRFSFDSTSRFEEDYSFFSDDVSIMGGKVFYFTADSLFALSADKYHFSSKKKEASIVNFTVTPRYEKFDFGPMVGTQTDWVKTTIPEIHFFGIGIDGWFEDRAAVLRKVEITSPNIEVFRDKRIPFPQDQWRELPQILLREADLGIALDTLIINNAFVQYQEFAEDATQEGTIFFDRMDVQLSNIVNTPMRLASGADLNFTIDANLMGKGRVAINGLVDLSDPEGQFSIKGKVGPMDLKELNDILEHVAFVKIRSGFSNSIEFSWEADDYYALGEMKFNYKDLKISLISKKSQTESGLGASIGSFFANTFMVRSNNPNFLLIRGGDIFFERDHTKSIFNYWSKTFLSGIVSSIGAKSNKRDIRRKNRENLKIKREQLKEEKLLEENIGVYD